MKGKGNRQVSPKTAAVVILALLVGIQIVWWRGLVTRPKPERRGGQQGGGPSSPVGPPLLYGREDVRVETFAGGPEPGRMDGPGHAARFAAPTGLALSPDGALIVADTLNHAIRRVETGGKTSTLAGGGPPGYADGPAAQARFNLPCGVASGPDGAVYVADTGNHRIRRIKDGTVTTLAGGAGARFRLPSALAYQGGMVPGLVVADSGNRRVRILTLSGHVRPGGWSVAGTPVGLAPEQGKAFAVSGAGIVFPDGRALRNVPMEMQGNTFGKPADYTLRNPVAICAAPDGWFVSASGHAAIFHVRGDIAHVVAGRAQGPILASGWRDEDGRDARFGEIGGLVSDGHGHLFVADTGNNCIRRVTLPQALAGAPAGSAAPTGKETLR